MVTARAANPPTTPPAIAPVAFFFGGNGGVVILAVGERLEVGLSLDFDDGSSSSSCIALSNAVTATVWLKLQNEVRGGPVQGNP